MVKFRKLKSSKSLDSKNSNLVNLKLSKINIFLANHLNSHLAANNPDCAAPRPPQSPAKRNQKIDIFIYHYQLPQKPRASLRSLQPHSRPISAIYIYTLFHAWLYRRESTSNGPPNNYDRALTGRGGFEFPSAYSVA